MNRLAPIAPKVSKSVQARILTLDIERIPGRATVEHRGLEITGAFWDLSQWKHTIGRRIPPDNVTTWPRSICAAAKWYGDRNVMFAAEWDDGGHEAFMRATWEWYDEADIVVGHNIAGFDSRHLKSGWAEYGWPSPAPWKTVDTLKVARAEFAFESNTLDALCKRLGVTAKSDKYDAAVAHAAVDGDAKAQAQLRKYNIGDVKATEGAYDRLRPWMTGHPHLGLWVEANGDGESWACPTCGHKALIHESDRTIKTNVQQYRAFRCPKCGHQIRGNVKLRNPIQTRSAR